MYLLLNNSFIDWIRQRTPSTSPEPELTTEFHQETKNDQEPESEDERPDSEKNENDLTNDSNNPEKEMEENREITIDVRLLDNDQPSRTELLPSKCDVDESFTSENGGKNFILNHKNKGIQTFKLINL